MRYQAVLLTLLLALPATAQEPSYNRDVRPFLGKYCSECHNVRTHKGGLNLDTYKALVEGAEEGPVVVPGTSSKSKLVTLLRGNARPMMPPARVQLRPTTAEIAKVAAWIDAGAKDDGGSITIAAPKILPRNRVAPPVTGLVFGSQWMWGGGDRLRIRSGSVHPRLPDPISALGMCAAMARTGVRVLLQS